MTSCCASWSRIKHRLCQNLHGYHRNESTRASDRVSVQSECNPLLSGLSERLNLCVCVSLLIYALSLSLLPHLFLFFLCFFILKSPKSTISSPPGLVLRRFTEVSSPHSDHERRRVVSACRSLQARHHSQGAKHTQISPKLSLNRNIHRHTNRHSDVKIQNESSAW